MEKITIHTLYGVDTAMHLLRPGARWEITNSRFTLWEDPRPCPTWKELQETMEKIKAFEESINTIWLPEQIEHMKRQQAEIDRAMSEQN